MLVWECKAGLFKILGPELCFVTSVLPQGSWRLRLKRKGKREWSSTKAIVHCEKDHIIVWGRGRGLTLPAIAAGV